MDLKRIALSAVRGFHAGQDLEISLPGFTVFIGPNGTGKTTILEAMACAMEVLAQRKIEVRYPSGVRATQGVVRLQYERQEYDSPFEGHLAALLGRNPEFIELEIKIDRSRAVLQVIRTPQGPVRVDKKIGKPNEVAIELTAIQKRIEQLNQGLARLRSPQKRRPGQPAPNVAGDTTKLQRELVDRQAREKQLQAQLASPAVVIEWTPLQESSITTGEAVFVDLLNSLNPSGYIYLAFGTPLPDRTTEMLTQMIVSKQGRDESFFRATAANLSSFLESPSTAYRDGEQDFLHIAGVIPEHLSSGSQISLRYFALEQMEKRSQLVLWDEPENGLHSTRRHKLLSVMLGDRHRYVVATHAPEFVPLDNATCAAYRMSSRFDDTQGRMELAVEPIHSRRHVFSTLEALGINPSTTLFTANSVLWLEGPSDMVFWRWALGQHPDSAGLLPGFDFTILMYGGSTISYLEISDDPQIDSDLVDMFSVCRRALIVVDSDFESQDEFDRGPQALKKAPGRLLAAAGKASAERPGCARLIWTPGRELENHYPDEALRAHVASTQQEPGRHVMQFSVGQFERYHEAIRTAVIADEQFSIYGGKQVPRGSSRWDSGAKVEIAKAIVSTPGIRLSDLRWGMADIVADVARWLRDARHR